MKEGAARLPFSAACERNKGPILARLENILSASSRVLEIGSGTGQHAVHFASGMPWLTWTCADRLEYHPGLRARIEDASLGNILGPVMLDVTQPWPGISIDAIFSANTAHIMPWPAVVEMFQGAGRSLPAGGRFVLYGPFHYGGQPTGEGNALFDRDLLARGGGEGIRDVEAVHGLAADNRLKPLADCAMPANNRLLVWEKFE